MLACHVCAIIKLLVCGSLMRRKSQSHGQFSFGERFLFGTQLDDQLFVPCCRRWEKYAKSERQGHLSWSRRVVWHYALPVTPTDTLPAASINTHAEEKRRQKLPPCCVRERRRYKNPTWANAAATASSSSPFVKCIIFYTPSSTA
jgi:hypothetical protein